MWTTMKTKYIRIGKNEKKIDALALATGSRRFVDDFELKHCLHCKLIYSPHAFADILEIDESAARALDGVVDVFSYKNTPQILHTSAGQGFPEPSPYDQYLFDKTVRFAGDRVAMVVAESSAIAEAAAKKIRIRYRLREPLFDPEKAMEADAPKLHGAECYTPIGATYDPQRNLAAEVDLGFGNLKQGEADADLIFDETYRAHYSSHCAIEPHSVKTYFDEEGRLVILASTQVPFHVRRIVSRVCEFPIAKIRVIKPRIGGGFGGKQEVLLEPLAALVTLRYKRPARIVLSREEVFQNTRTRHPVRVRLRTGVKKDGSITFLEMDSLLNSGAYGSHALTVLSNCGSKVLPLLNKIDHLRFLGRSVYTNLPVGGAYRGYGATQGYFALNQHLDILCRKLNLDLPEYLKKNHIREGETSKVFEALGEGKTGVRQYVNSCKLDKCIDICTREIGWYEKRGKRLQQGDKVRGVGLAVAMQGSGIPLVDMGAASIKMNEDGSFNLDIGATDIGTGSDTVLAQIAAEVLNVDLTAMIVLSSDTDRTPFDVGAYASSTTFVSGRAVRKCAEKIREQILGVAAEMLDLPAGKLQLAPASVVDPESGKRAGYPEICRYAMYTANQFQIHAVASEFVEESPPPFLAQAVEVEVDTRTGVVKLLKLVSAVDCGQAINPRLAEGQIEGAAVNGVSYAMTEEYLFSPNGSMINKNFKNYKILTAADLPEMKTFVVPSHEPSGPFGAKSAGEIGINCPMPAIANAIFDAVGVRLFEAPFTPEKVYKAMFAQKDSQ